MEWRAEARRLLAARRPGFSLPQDYGAEDPARAIAALRAQAAGAVRR